MSIDQQKKEVALLIDAIVGRGFHGIEDAKQFVQLGYAKFTGNQHNIEWQWVRRKLIKTMKSDLERIYYRR